MKLVSTAKIKIGRFTKIGGCYSAIGGCQPLSHIKGENVELTWQSYNQFDKEPRSGG